MNINRKKVNIFLVGPLGAGKTTIGRAIARELHLIYLDSDHVIAERTGVDLSWIFDMEGEEGFRERETFALEELTQKNHIVLATGGGSILCQKNRDLLKANGTVIYLMASIQQQLKRTKYNMHNRPLLRCDDVQKRLECLEEIRRPLYEEVADFKFSTEKGRMLYIAKEIISCLKSNGF